MFWLLHLSWAFLHELFDISSFLNNFCEIVHFQKGGGGIVSLTPPSLAAPVYMLKDRAFDLNLFSEYVFKFNKFVNGTEF